MWQAAVLSLATLLAGCAAGNLNSGIGSFGNAGNQNSVGANHNVVNPANALPPGTTEPSAKIAVLLPLTARGQAAPVANGLKQAAELALFEQNNPNVALIFKDTAGTIEGARAAAEGAAADGAVLILGPLYAQNVKAARTAPAAQHIPMIAFSNDRTVAGPGTYLLGFLAEDEVDRIVAFAAGRGKRRFAALLPNDSYGRIVKRAFHAAVARSGGQVVAAQDYPPGTTGLLSPARKLFERVRTAGERGQPVDAVFIPGGPDVLPSLAPLLNYANGNAMQIRFLGSGGWDYPSVGRNSMFVGGWYPAPDPRGWREFSKRFVKTFGSAPPRIASLSYDAVTIAVTLAQSYPKGQRYTPANLARPSGFIGVDGPVRLNGNGIPDRGLAILEVQKFGSQVIDPAPRSRGPSQTLVAPRGYVAATSAVR